jgi:hypothetical protein
LPVLSPKRAPVAMRMQALVATQGDAVLVARRAEAARGGGLFVGLWEPPSVVGPARARRALLAAFPLRDAERIGAVEHVLSHRRLMVDVLHAELTGTPDPACLPGGYDAARVVPRRMLRESERTREIATSTLTRKILALAGVRCIV